MSEDIIKFWSPSQMPLGAFIHPKDQIVIDRIQNRFHKDCLPASFYRPLINARVILLFLSLGYTEFDSRHAETAKGRNYYERQRRGTADLPTKEEHPLVHQWLTRILRQFDLEATSVGDKLAILNLCAYHSRKFHDFHMLTTLPSSRAALDYAQFVLFPQAEAGERVVVCLRTHRLWGLEKGKCYGAGLFAPSATPGGIMHHIPIREHIIRSVRSAVGAAIDATTPA